MAQRLVHIPQVPSPSSHPGGDHDDDLSPAVRSGWTDQEAGRAYGLLNVSWVQNGVGGENPELKLKWKGQHLRSAGSTGRGEGLSALPWKRTYGSWGWGLDHPPHGHPSRTSRKRWLPPFPHQPGGAPHQGDEVGEGESQGDLHALLFVRCGPQFLVVGLLLKQVPDQPLLLVQAPAAWGGWGTGAQGGRCFEVLLGMQWDPRGRPLQGKNGRGSGEVGLMLGEGVPGERRREETMHWGPFGEGDGHSYRTRPGQPAAPALTQALPSCSSDWVLGLPLRSAGLGSVGGFQGDRCRVGVWRGEQRKEAAGNAI